MIKIVWRLRRSIRRWKRRSARPWEHSKIEQRSKVRRSTTSRSRLKKADNKTSEGDKALHAAAMKTQQERFDAKTKVEQEYHGAMMETIRGEHAAITQMKQEERAE